MYIFCCPGAVAARQQFFPFIIAQNVSFGQGRFLSQSFHVAEQFTGMPGQYVPLKETLRGFKMILSGECDELPESAFLFAGTIDDVFAKAKKG